MKTNTLFIIILIAGRMVSAETECKAQESFIPDEKRSCLTIPEYRSLSEFYQTSERKRDTWDPNPNPYKYLVGNSAIPMKKFTGYYQNIWVFFNNVGFAFTDWFSLSLGFELFSLMVPDEGPFIFTVNPKVSFNVARNLYVGGNILYVNSIRQFEDFQGLGTFNAFATYGNPNYNVTGAVGWGWINYEFSGKPLVTISGMARVSNRIAFVSENWILPGVIEGGGYYGVVSYGIRFLSGKSSFDLAFVNNKDISEVLFIGFPLLDFVFIF